MVGYALVRELPATIMVIAGAVVAVTLLVPSPGSFVAHIVGVMAIGGAPRAGGAIAGVVSAGGNCVVSTPTDTIQGHRFMTSIVRLGRGRGRRELVGRDGLGTAAKRRGVRAWRLEPFGVHVGGHAGVKDRRIDKRL